MSEMLEMLVMSERLGADDEVDEGDGNASDIGILDANDADDACDSVMLAMVMLDADNVGDACDMFADAMANLLQAER